MYSYVQVMCVLSQRTDIDEAEIFAQLQNYNCAGLKSYGVNPPKKFVFVRVQQYPPLVISARDQEKCDILLVLSIIITICCACTYLLFSTRVSTTNRVLFSSNQE